MNKFLGAILFLLIAVTANCQTNSPQMADTFRSDGKIYVVVLVLSIVFTCLATYLIILDRKLKKLEKKQ
jgi:heme/copper-type cytochrome/quinol oxidase subunit 4